MSALPRTILHPGPPENERIIARPAAGKTFSMHLEAGLPLLTAVQRGFAREGFASGVCELAGITFARLSYCIPALAKTPDHVAFYSETFRPAGPTVIEHGALTFGQRDGAPFFHAHGLWREADGKRTGGHILTDQTFLAKPAIVRATGMRGVGFIANPDAETGFTLFAPVDSTAGTHINEPTTLMALRLRPNTDFCSALETVCAANHITQARLRGGVGSTIGARFEDEREAPHFATEVFVRQGSVTTGADGRLEAIVDVGLIDYMAMVHEGRLKRGDNPVLITFELILEANQPWATTS